MANVTELAPSEPGVLTTIGIAIGIFLIGLILGRLMSRLTRKLLDFMNLEDLVFKKSKRKFSLHALLAGIVELVIDIVFAIIALNYVGVTSVILTVLGIVAIFVLAMSAFLSLRDSLPNLVAYSKIARKISVDDRIEIDSVKGRVKSISVLEVEVETKQGETIHIPNRLFIKKEYRKHGRT